MQKNGPCVLDRMCMVIDMKRANKFEREKVPCSKSESQNIRQLTGNLRLMEEIMKIGYVRVSKQEQHETLQSRKRGKPRRCASVQSPFDPLMQPGSVEVAYISLENALDPLIESSFESLVSPLIPCLQPLIIDAM